MKEFFNHHHLHSDNSELTVAGRLRSLDEFLSSRSSLGAESRNRGLSRLRLFKVIIDIILYFVLF